MVREQSSGRGWAPRVREAIRDKELGSYKEESGLN